MNTANNNMEESLMSKIVTIPTCQNPFVVMVNHQKYVYPAGETLEVPDEVAHIIENHSHELLPVIGGGSGVNEAIGTWQIVDEPDLSTLPSDGFCFMVYECDGVRGAYIHRSLTGSPSWGIYNLNYQGTDIYTCNPSGSYGISHGWVDEAYKTITILTITDEPHSREFVAWLKANAVRKG